MDLSDRQSNRRLSSLISRFQKNDRPSPEETTSNQKQEAKIEHRHRNISTSKADDPLDTTDGSSKCVRPSTAGISTENKVFHFQDTQSDARDKVAKNMPTSPAASEHKTVAKKLSSEVMTPIAKEISPASEVKTTLAKAISPASKVMTPVAKEISPASEGKTMVAKKTNPAPVVKTTLAKVISSASEVEPTVANTTSPRSPIRTTVYKPTSPASEVEPTVANTTSPRSPIRTTVYKPTSPASEVKTTVAKETGRVSEIKPTIAKEISPASEVKPLATKEISHASDVKPLAAKEISPASEVKPLAAKEISPASEVKTTVAKETNPASVVKTTLVKEISPSSEGKPTLASETNPRSPIKPTAYRPTSPASNAISSVTRETSSSSSSSSSPDVMATIQPIASQPDQNTDESVFEDSYNFLDAETTIDTDEEHDPDTEAEAEERETHDEDDEVDFAAVDDSVNYDDIVEFDVDELSDDSTEEELPTLQEIYQRCQTIKKKRFYENLYNVWQKKVERDEKDQAMTILTACGFGKADPDELGGGLDTALSLIPERFWKKDSDARDISIEDLKMIVEEKKDAEERAQFREYCQAAEQGNQSTTGNPRRRAAIATGGGGKSSAILHNYLRMNLLKSHVPMYYFPSYLQRFKNATERESEAEEDNCSD